ncbi:MAG: TRAP transporter small permease subunit [Alphaproteobacteria bacterium]|nr:TRAP transporter small permease subunit [Alphaproteobacteria bacterium]
MSEITAPLAKALHAILPSWVVLPNMTFVLPHWIYWSGIILFPLVAAFLVHRAEKARTGQRVSLPVAYMFLIASGFVGLHRFYLRAGKMAVVFIALFFLVLHGNDQGAAEREAVSKRQNDLKIAAFERDHFKTRAEQGYDGANAQAAKAEATLKAVEARLAAARLERAQWNAFSGFFSYLIFILLVIDACLLPRLHRACLEREPPGEEKEFEVMERGPKPDPRRDIQVPFTLWVDRINDWTGTYVAYWAVIAVFIYYYEVLARYVFNAPTNWAHEGMFLMFGMQYLLAGGFAYLNESHVRVDVLYEKRSFRTKAIIDIITSVFFFIFVLALFWTGLVFALDAIEVQETTLNEWGIQYWPVKLAIPIGAFLLMLQGIAKLIRDILYLRGVRATDATA